MSQLIDVSKYRVAPCEPVDLAALPTAETGGFEKKNAERELESILKRVDELQGRLFAESRQSLLVVLQAMDTGGKDSTIRSVFGPLNPQGVRVWNFKAPTDVERDHDFLWRVHKRSPRAGYIGVFNRSQYEDVLIARVKNLVSRDVWENRYEHINAFEKLLVDEGSVELKFYLHISREFQRSRLQRRLDKPHKHWKLNSDDLKERARWRDYQHAYEQALSRCSTEVAPWYVIPAETRYYRDIVIASVLVNTLERMNPQYPEANFDSRSIVIE